MYAAVSSLKDLIKLGAVTTSNQVFQLHCKLTVLILLVFSVIVTTNQFFGDPIDCFTAAAGEVPGNVLDNFCWIHSTFVLPSEFNKNVGTHVISPGIGKAVPGQEKTYQSYYQWVGFFLFFQAILFYIPKYLWKVIEGGRIKQIILGLDHPIIEKESERGSKVNTLATYVNTGLGRNHVYAYGFAFCEVLNFINVICQIYFTDTFLGGEFTTYGTEVVQFTQMEQVNRTDPMIQVFPRVTKCTFMKYGPSGDIQMHDALCVLPINIINEKIFIFLWFWYIILAIFCGLALIYRLGVIFVEKFRVCVLTCRNRYADKHRIRSIITKSQYGDWFMLHYLGKNIDIANFCDLIEQLDDMLCGGEANGNGNCLKTLMK